MIGTVLDSASADRRFGTATPARSATIQDRLAELFDRHHRRIYLLARRMVRDAEEARDLLQETFLRAARRARSIPSSEPKAEAWLVRIVVNLCRDRGRRLAVRAAHHHRLEPPLAAANPEASAVARSTVEAALATLPARRRAVVVLSELEELSGPEIARLLGIPAATVRWHLAQARRQLADLLVGTETSKEMSE